MIQSYQKINTILNFAIEKADAFFMSHFFVKTCLEFYFIEYSDVSTQRMHEISKENMQHILSIGDTFTDDDLEYLKARFDIDRLYKGEKLPSETTPSLPDYFGTKVSFGTSVNVSTFFKKSDSATLVDQLLKRGANRADATRRSIDSFSFGSAFKQSNLENSTYSFYSFMRLSTEKSSSDKSQSYNLKHLESLITDADIDSKMSVFDVKIRQLGLLLIDFLLRQNNSGLSETEGIPISTIIDQPRKSAEQIVQNMGANIRKAL